MKLKSVYVRFYKSFNYDYLRKLELDNTEKPINPMPWEFINNKFYPHVNIQIDSQITTVVGANESGKSHLLSAIEKARYGEKEDFKIEQEDFCRYSHFFNSVEKNIPRYPDFGLEWTNLTEGEQEYLKTLYTQESDEILNFSHFYFFRDEKSITIYIPKKGNAPTESEEGSDESEETISVSSKKEEDAKLRFAIIRLDKIKDDFLPPVFRIDSKIALPDRVLISDLLKGKIKTDDDFTAFDRQEYIDSVNNLKNVKDLLSEILNSKTSEDNKTTLNKTTLDKTKKLASLLKGQEISMKDDERISSIKSFNLVHDLIFKIAEINLEDLKMLSKGLRHGKGGIVKSVEDKINLALANRLRFPRIWSQDKNFALRVDATEVELNFIISDRTECQYSFDERSGGLKHFLSYYIQYLTHETPNGAGNEVLLMDEPDAYLSGEAQQDLMKIFQLFADPTSPGSILGRKPVQVVYVTHSPFLIDKNHSERVLALEKPEGRKGTQVIPGPSQNRYEPLRSAFGAFLGETIFMSQCNLMVEGPADQILIAGVVNYLRYSGRKILESEILDLNKITIVPCGGAPNVPYMAYLAIGRGTERPAVIVLLDSDEPGNDAKQKLNKDGEHPGNKAVLKQDFILQLGDITREEVGWKVDDANKLEKPFVDLEDLVPIPLAIRVVKNFLHTFFDLTEDKMTGITELAIQQKKANAGKSTFSSIQDLVSELDNNKNYSIDKVPFAKTLIEILPQLLTLHDPEIETELAEFEANIRALLKRLKQMQIKAEEGAKEKNQRKKVQQKINTFLSDYKDQSVVQRDIVSLLLNDIASDLEGSQLEKEIIGNIIIQMRKNHRLLEDPSENILDFEMLLTDLEKLSNAKEIARNWQNRMPD